MALCLSVSVCPSQVGVLLKWIELISGLETSFHYPTLYCKEIRVTRVPVTGLASHGPSATADIKL